MKKGLLVALMMVLSSLVSAETFKLVNAKTLGENDFYSSGSKVVKDSFNYVYTFKLVEPEKVDFGIKVVDNKNYSFSTLSSFLYGGSFYDFTFIDFGESLLNNVVLVPGIYSYSVYGLTDGLKGGKFDVTLETSHVPAVPEPETLFLLLTGLTVIAARKRFKS